MHTLVVLYHDDYSEMVSVLYSFSYNFLITDKECNACEYVWLLLVVYDARG
jgi:hypothetical protein